MPQEFLIDRRNILMQYNGRDETVTIPEGAIGVDTNAFKDSTVKKVIFPESLFCCSGGNGLVSATIEEITITNARFRGVFVESSLPSLKRINVIDDNDVRRGDIAVLASNLAGLSEKIELYIPNLVLYAVDTTAFMDVKMYKAYDRNKHLYTDETGASYEEYMRVHRARFLEFLIKEGDVESLKQHIREFDPHTVASLYNELSEFEDIELNAVVSNIISKSDAVVKSDALDFSFLTNFFDGNEEKKPTSTTTDEDQVTDLQKAREDFEDFDVCYAEGNRVILGSYKGSATEITIPAKYKGYEVEAVGVPYTRSIPSSIKSITIEEGVIALQPMSMPCYNNLVSITLPASLKHISFAAFATHTLNQAQFKCKAGTYAWRWAKEYCKNVVEV